MTIPIYQVDAFTPGPFSGNPAADEEYLMTRLNPFDNGVGSDRNANPS